MKHKKFFAYAALATLWAGQVFAKGPLQPMTIQLSWLPNVGFARVLLAKERGWHEEPGIDLTIKGWKAGVSPIDEVSSMKARVGVAEGPKIIEANARGKSLTAIAATFQKPACCLLSKDRQAIRTLAQLRGKKIGIGTSDSALMTKALLANKGISPNESLQQQTESLKVFQMLASLGEGRKYLGWMEEDYWIKGLDILHKFKQIGKNVPTKEVFTKKFWKTSVLIMRINLSHSLGLANPNPSHRSL